MYLDLLMLFLLVGLFVLSAALVRFAEHVIDPQSQGRGETSTEKP